MQNTLNMSGLVGWPFLMSCLQAASKPGKLIHLLGIVYDIAQSQAPGVRCEVPRRCLHDDISVTHARCQVLSAIAVRSCFRLKFGDPHCKFFNWCAHW